jgi:hypothetical protein
MSCAALRTVVRACERWEGGGERSHHREPVENMEQGTSGGGAHHSSGRG